MKTDTFRSSSYNFWLCVLCLGAKDARDRELSILCRTAPKLQEFDDLCPKKPRKIDEKRDFAVFRDLWLTEKSWRKMAKEKKIDLAPANKMS